MLDAWSGQPLLDTAEELRAYTAMARDVWLIRGTDRQRPGLPDPEAVWGPRIQDASRVFLSRDDRIEVLHVTLGKSVIGTGSSKSADTDERIFAEGVSRAAKNHHKLDRPTANSNRHRLRGRTDHQAQAGRKCERVCRRSVAGLLGTPGEAAPLSRPFLVRWYRLVE